MRMKGEWIKFSNISLIELFIFYFFFNFYLKYNFKHMSESLGNTVIQKHWGRRRQQLEYKKATQSIEE